MSQLYSIQESTLTDIGDALRGKYGETKLATMTFPVTIFKNPKATGFNSYGGYETFSAKVHVFKCPGASRIEVVYTSELNHPTYPSDYLKYAIGEYTTSTFPSDGALLDYTNDNIIRYLTLETDTVTISARKNSYTGYGYYIQCTGYDASGNPIEVEGCSYTEKEVEVKNTYSSADVAGAIDRLGKAVEPIVLTGNQKGACGNDITDAYIRMYGDTITTKDLGDTTSMFEKSKLEYIPFDLNYASSGYTYHQSQFNSCNNLKEAPKMLNARPYNSLLYLFGSCWNLRHVPEDYFDTWYFDYMASVGAYMRQSGIYSNCYSLRSMPLGWWKKMPSASNNTGNLYYEGFRNCYSLDEVVDIPNPYTTVTWTSNYFGQTFDNCHRLKRITFETNEDGTPLVVQWKSQTIDLSKYVGYANSSSTNILNYNSGITADKLVSGYDQYVALKNDPDWYSITSVYSRYNHNSAVETINSLPDTSAYLASSGGTNTIKFLSASGQNTDGGAINTLTEEEIAVATAKGWTVSLA